MFFFHRIALHFISCTVLYCFVVQCLVPSLTLPLQPFTANKTLSVNPYPGGRRQNETEMFSDHDETSPSIAAVSAPSTACSMLAVQQQKRLCRQFIDVSAARRGCHTMKCAVYDIIKAQCLKKICSCNDETKLNFAV